MSKITMCITKQLVDKRSKRGHDSGDFLLMDFYPNHLL